MLQWMRRLRRYKDLAQIDLLRPIPILSAEQIIDGLGLAPALKSIERLTGAGNAYFNTLYRPALHRFIEAVQLLPASASHHHAGPGGLVTHTLDVIDISLRIRKSYNLPQYSTPEIIYAQEHVWTYGIFAAALLHDIGKTLCSTRIKIGDDAYWTLYQGSILKSGASHYHVDFIPSRYKLHTQLASTCFDLLPGKGRAWLTQYTDVLAQLSAWLIGDHFEFGAIGEIVRQADSRSVSQNLKIGGDRVRFPGAPSVPLVDRLTTALRQLLDDGSLKLNRPDGSAGWCDGQYTYLVCGTAADAVKHHLYEAGATDIPSDNTRIFDTWADHGYALETPGGRAIWHLTINDALTLTVLKFETARLFHPSRRPTPFEGDLKLDEGGQDLAGTPSKPTSADLVGSANKPIETAATTHSAAGDPFAGPITASTDHVKDFYMVGSDADKDGSVTNTPETNSPRAAPMPASFTLDDPDIGQHFLDWVRQGLREGKIHTNRSTALIHIVKEGVLIVSPLAFKDFIRKHEFLLDDLAGSASKPTSADLGGSSTKPTLKHRSADDAVRRIQSRLQRQMTMAGHHRKTAKGINIHTYQVTGANKTSKIRGWLLPLDSIYGAIKPPDINKKLSNLTGFTPEKK